MCSTLCSWFRYLAARLVINWLSSHEDPTLQRMTVAVISLLVAKVKTLLTCSAFSVLQDRLIEPINSLCRLLYLRDASFSRFHLVL